MGLGLRSTGPTSLLDAISFYSYTREGVTDFLRAEARCNRREYVSIQTIYPGTKLALVTIKGYC